MVWENTRKLILGQFEGFKLPEWFVRNHHFVVNSLPDWDTIKMYNLFHDCGKPFCLVTDSEGKQHFPNHAEISARVFSEYYPAFPEVSELIGLDMLMHTSKLAEIMEKELSNKILATLLITALAEIHSNASMFGGTESVSFKIKYKNLDKIGKGLIKRFEKHDESYLYVIVRKDIPDAHKVVQSGHAIFEQAKLKDKHPSFVVLGAHDEDDLKNTMKYLLDSGVQFSIFRESMNPYNGAITAIATEPLVGIQREVLKQFQLLKM